MTVEPITLMIRDYETFQVWNRVLLPKRDIKDVDRMMALQGKVIS